MNAEAEESAGQAQANSERPATDAAAGAVLAAGAALFAALRNVIAALLALLTAEVRVLRASVAVVFVASIALMAFSVSLWACAVALIGWALVLATHSIGIALAILVALHVVLAMLAWLTIQRAIRRASFPAVRTELRALGGELRRDVARFQHAAPAPDREPSP